MAIRHLLCLFTIMVFGCVCAFTEPISFGSAKLLFLDDFYIASSNNITRTIHPAQKHPDNPLLWPSEPWEGNVALTYGSVLQDNGLFRMWYHTSQGVGYAESQDGIHWQKPVFDCVLHENKPTNIVIARDSNEGSENTLPYFYEIFGVFKDLTDNNPQSRYKMGVLSIQFEYEGPRESAFHPKQRRGLTVAGSPDGLHWKPIKVWATESICDGGTYWMYDPKRKKYVLYGRTKYIPPDVEQAWADDEWCQKHFWGRSVARAESKDFIEWDYTDPATAPVVMSSDTNDEPGTEIYSMQVFPYESIYIGLVQVFHNQEDACHLDIQLAVSHDGVSFGRVGDRSPFIPVGPIGTWDRFNTSTANNFPIEIDDELRFYYSGRTSRHSPYQGLDKGESGGGIGLATIQRDRFVSLNASFDSGTFVTKPLTVSGGNLHLNAISDFGEIVVEALDANGEVIAKSGSIRDDALDIPVTWEEGKITGLDTPVQFRFTLRNAHLFAIRME